MNNVSSPSICPACGAANLCAVAQGAAAESCWCNNSAALLPLPTDTAARCYCRACLQKLLATDAVAATETRREGQFSHER